MAIQSKAIDRCVTLIVAVVFLWAIYEWYSTLVDLTMSATYSVLACDLASYVEAKDQRMPLSWAHFEEWSATHGKQWKAKDLSTRVQLRWGAQVVDVDRESFITVLKSSHQKYAMLLNSTFRAHLSAGFHKRGEKIPASLE